MDRGGALFALRARPDDDMAGIRVVAAGHAPGGGFRLFDQRQGGGGAQITILPPDTDAAAELAGPAGILAHLIGFDDPGCFGFHHFYGGVAATRFAEVHDGIFAVAARESAKTDRLVATLEPHLTGFRMGADADHAEDIATAAGGDVFWHTPGKGFEDHFRRQ